MSYKLGFATLVTIGLTSFGLGAGTLAFFTANNNWEETRVVAGRVSLGQPAVTAVNPSPIVPGRAGWSLYEVEYTGNVDAWLLLSTRVNGSLLTCDGGGRLSVIIQDLNTGQHFDLNADRQVIGSGSRVPGSKIAIRTRWEFSSAAGNDCQEKTASIRLMIQAVQSDLNTDPVNGGPIAW